MTSSLFFLSRSLSSFSLSKTNQIVYPKTNRKSNHFLLLFSFSEQKKMAKSMALLSFLSSFMIFSLNSLSSLVIYHWSSYKVITTQMNWLKGGLFIHPKYTRAVINLIWFFLFVLAVTSSGRFFFPPNCRRNVIGNATHTHTVTHTHKSRGNGFGREQTVDR